MGTMTLCRNREIHEPHEFEEGGYLPIPRTVRQCEGLGEQYLRFTRIKDWRRLRDEIAPAIQRQFPGVIVRADEEVVVTYTPPTADTWKGASLTILGLHPKTADVYVRIFGSDVSWSTADSAEQRNLTPAEQAEVEAHRVSRKK